MNFNPSFDIKENDNEISVNVEVPGVKKENINIELNDGYLIISGDKKIEKKDEKENYYTYERSFGSFERQIRVPKNF